MKLPIMYFYPASCYFLPSGSSLSTKSSKSVFFP